MRQQQRRRRRQQQQAATQSTAAGDFEKGDMRSHFSKIRYHKVAMIRMNAKAAFFSFSKPFQSLFEAFFSNVELKKAQKVNPPSVCVPTLCR
jgi:hypothetical protein